MAEVDLDAQLRQVWDRFMPYTFVDGNRMYASFTHLIGYSSNYYTYALDKVIAVDPCSRFDKDNPSGGTASSKYRQYLINPGATKPAAPVGAGLPGTPAKYGRVQDMAERGVQLGGEVGEIRRIGNASAGLAGLTSADAANRLARSALCAAVYRCVARREW